MAELECLTYGVGHAEEGVCLLLRLGSYRVLLDCGLRDLSPLVAYGSVSPADLVLCSHAHADHARGLLALHQAFPHLPIYASEVTTQLLPLNWTESATNMPALCQALPWRTPIEFLDGLTAELYPAGHLPGAAATLLTYTSPTSHRTYSIFYTGDFFLSNSRLVEGLPLDELRRFQPNVVILEGSYGTARHPHRRQQENQLAEQISLTLATGRSVLLPVSAIGLAQELLILLRSHHSFTGRSLDIWVDPAVAAVCDAYLEIVPHLPAAVQNFARHQPLFWDERVRPRVYRLEPGQHPPTEAAPCILLVDETTEWSHYYQSDPQQWLVMLSQEPHHPRSPLAEGIASKTYLLAHHCDGAGTTQLIHNLRPQHVVFVHGSPAYLGDLTGLEGLHSRYQVHMPATDSLVELPIGETFLQPAAPETNYEGEVSESETEIHISLPSSISSDPRWQTLANTGVIEARWQGEELVLRGVSQQELLQQGDRLVDWVDVNSPLRQRCANCLHHRGQRCRNPLSPLFEFKVTPDGFCPVFEPMRIPGQNPSPES